MRVLEQKINAPEKLTAGEKVEGCAIMSAESFRRGFPAESFSD